ncbi:MAG: cytochrome c [Rhodobacter sp.]|nr:cytochrome c [Rhodobacter sp.]
MSRKMVGTMIFAAGLSVSAATAVADVSAERGATLAAEHCTACHDVSADGAFKEYPPSFASIAVYRSREQIEGRMLYPPQHASMPQLAFIMKPAEIDDLVAYIVSLERDMGE